MIGICNITVKGGAFHFFNSSYWTHYPFGTVSFTLCTMHFFSYGWCVGRKIHCKTSALIASSKCIYCWSNAAAKWNISVQLFNNTKAVFDETQGLLIQQSECINWLECCVKVLNSALQSLLCTGSYPLNLIMYKKGNLVTHWLHQPKTWISHPCKFCPLLTNNGETPIPLGGAKLVITLL